jgi:hypothetical protein
LTQLFTSIVLSLFWFQPALWFAAARLRSEQEHACDDRVITAGAAPFAYARTLLNVAAGRHGDPDLASAAAHMAPHTQLEGRLNAIVAERRRRVLGVASRVLAIGAGFTVLIAAATAAPAPQPVTSPPEGHAPTASTPPAAFAAPATTFPIGEQHLADAEDVRNLEDSENGPNPEHAPTPRTRRAPPSRLSAPPAIAPLRALPTAPAAPAVAATPAAPASRAAPVSRAAPPAPVSRAAPPAFVAPIAPVSRAAPPAPIAPAMPLAPPRAVPASPVVAPTPAAPAIAPTPTPSPHRVRAPGAHPSD